MQDSPNAGVSHLTALELPLITKHVFEMSRICNSYSSKKNLAFFYFDGYKADTVAPTKKDEYITSIADLQLQTDLRWQTNLKQLVDGA